MDRWSYGCGEQARTPVVLVANQWNASPTTAGLDLAAVRASFARSANAACPQPATAAELVVATNADTVPREAHRHRLRRDAVVDPMRARRAELARWAPHGAVSIDRERAARAPDDVSPPRDRLQRRLDAGQLAPAHTFTVRPLLSLRSPRALRDGARAGVASRRVDPT
jgi:hypothetical protein